MFSGGTDHELERWLGNLLASHAKRVSPRIELELDPGAVRAGVSYSARLKLDGALRKRLGHAAREHAVARFSRETMLDRMEAVFAAAALPAGAV